MVGVGGGYTVDIVLPLFGFKMTVELSSKSTFKANDSLHL
jgi:hypothetical protein